jgi:hypothetical protein
MQIASETQVRVNCRGDVELIYDTSKNFSVRLEPRARLA